MKLRQAPAFATWFLKVFCSSAEHEAVVGDLMEQYQEGRGRFWYWRQVLDLVFLSLYSKAVRRPLTSTHRIPMGQIFTVILLIAVFAAILLSDIAPILLVAVAAGVLLGIMRFEQGPGPARPTLSDVPSVARIDSSKVPIRGGLAAGIVILILFTAAFHDVPELRRWALPGIFGGVIFAVILQLWRKVHPRDVSKDWLSIKSK